MFSVEPIPEPVQAPETFAADFDGRRAAATARRLVQLAPERAPGSEGDAAAADAVADRFAEIEAGKVSEQQFDGTIRRRGRRAPQRPADASGQLLANDRRRGRPRLGARLRGGVERGRDRRSCSRWRTSWAAPATRRRSCCSPPTGSPEGASGIREFVESYPTLEQVDAIVAISRPGASEPVAAAPAHLVGGPAEHVGAAGRVRQAGARRGDRLRAAGQGGFLGGLFRLAIPAGLGPEAVAISEGSTRSRSPGSGERSLEPGDDDVASLADESMAEFGNTTLALVLALDSAERPARPRSGRPPDAGRQPDPGLGAGPAHADPDPARRGRVGRRHGPGRAPPRARARLAALGADALAALPRRARRRLPARPRRDRAGPGLPVRPGPLRLRLALGGGPRRPAGGLRHGRGPGPRPVAARAPAARDAGDGSRVGRFRRRARDLVRSIRISRSYACPWPTSGSSAPGRRPPPASPGRSSGSSSRWFRSSRHSCTWRTGSALGAELPWTLVLFVTGGQIGFLTALLGCLDRRIRARA